VSARRRALLLVVLASALSACRINPEIELDRLASRPVDLDVPHFPQTENQCGPAALAGLLAASGIEAEPAALTAQIYLPGREGSLQAELLAASRRVGLLPIIIATAASDLVAALEAGQPVLVLLNLGTRSAPIWHYAVVTGLKPRENLIQLNSGADEALEMAAGRFMRRWNWAGNWGIVVARPGQIPFGVGFSDYANAVAAFESVAGDGAARPAWHAAISRWPAKATPFLALGNQAYRRKDLQGALGHYRDGLAVDGSDPALVNNAASVLGEMGCRSSALALLEPVLSRLDSESPWAPILYETQQELATGPIDEKAGCQYR